MERLTKVAIIGASAAGVAAATAMRQQGFDGSITLYDGDRRLPYERPPLSKALTGDGDALKLILPPEAYGDAAIDLVLGRRVVSVATRTVTLDDASATEFDRILIATGVAARRLPVPGADLDHVLSLRDADDAERVTARLAADGPLVIVGGGFIGLELAAVARGLGVEVTVVEVEAVPLARAVGGEVASLLATLHRDRGVRLLTNDSVASFHGGRAVEEVVLASGRTLPASTVVVGVGVTPNDQLAADAGAECAGGIVVSPLGQTSVPWLWAAGDVTVRPHRHLRRIGRIEHWDTAQRHGDAVGRCVLGARTEDAAVPYVWSDQYESTFQCFGRREPEDRVVIRDGAEPNSFVAFFLDSGRVRAAAGVDQPRAVRAAKTLIERDVSVDPDALRDPDTDLRRLSRPAA